MYENVLCIASWLLQSCRLLLQICSASPRQRTGTRPQARRATPRCVLLPPSRCRSPPLGLDVRSPGLTGHHIYMVSCFRTPLILDLILQRFWFCGMRLEPHTSVFFTTFLLRKSHTHRK